ncbi:hypothetical protein MMC26_002833 [Xylographa opegraphella]|nr:hypothetical protein [Xylographa opegraphella]
MSGALSMPCDPENMPTVRRRHVTNRHLWFLQSDTEEIHRATSGELGVPISGQENERLSEGFQAFPARQQNLSFAAKFDRLKSVATRRITSLPLTSALMKLQCDPQKPREQHLSLQKASIPEPYRSLGSYKLHVPPNSEDTSDFNSCRKSKMSRPTRSKSMSLLDASKTSYDQNLWNHIDDRPKWLVSQNGYNYSKIIGSKYCGTIDRSGSPFTPRTYGPTSPAMFVDDMSAYEVEGSLDGAISWQESTTSIRMDMLHLSQYRKLWDDLPLSQSPSLSKSMPPLRSSHLMGKETLRSSLSQFATPTVKAPSATPNSTLGPIMRKRPVDRGIYVSMQHESETEQDELNVPQPSMFFPVVDPGAGVDYMPLMKRRFDKPHNFQAPLLCSLPHTESQSFELPIRSPNGLTFIPNERADAALNPDQKDSALAANDLFVQSLHTKLDRLRYELSPGFRSPAPVHWKLVDENTPIWSQGPHKLSMPLRKRHSPRHLSIPPRRSTASLHNPPGSTAPPSPELTSWRTKLNRLRSRAGIEQLRPHAPTSTTLAAETGIDPAAWILPQPPDGIGPDPAAATALYLGGLGRARTLAHWQNGACAPSNKSVSSGQAALPDPPCKSTRGPAPMATARLRMEGGVWCPWRFARPAVEGELDGVAEGGVEGGRVDKDTGMGDRAG